MTSARGRDLGLAGSILVGIATIPVLVGLSILPFLNPVWLGIAQDRAEAVAWTGWPRQTVVEVTDALLHDLVIGPPEFATEVDGVPVFDERERSHMRDVRVVFSGVLAASLLGVVVLLGARRWSRGSRGYWRAVSRACLLVVGVVALLGVVFGIAFDAAFEFFHRVFFPAGTYAFDPNSSRLVQLLPGRLWYETSLAFGATLIVLASGLGAFAYRRSARRRRA